MGAIIEHKKFTLYVDYDRNKLHLLSIDGKIEYLKRRLDLVYFKPLRQIFKLFRRQAESSKRRASLDFLLIWGVILIAGIEVLGHYLSYKRSNKDCFRKFIENFMDDEWKKTPQNPPDSKTNKYWEWLRDSFRNGLVHGFYVKRGGFEYLNRGLLFEERSIDSNILLVVDPRRLWRDFNQGVKEFFKALSDHKSGYRKTFETRFDRTYIKGKD